MFTWRGTEALVAARISPRQKEKRAAMRPVQLLRWLYRYAERTGINHYFFARAAAALFSAACVAACVNCVVALFTLASIVSTACLVLLLNCS